MLEGQTEIESDENWG